MSAPKGHRWFAAGYDRMTRGNERQLGPIRRGLIAPLTGDVLEIGAGTGANFEYYSDEARVTAFEPDPYMLERARPKLRPNIDLRQAPAEALPVADASSDVVVATLVLCTVDDVPRTLSEVRRVLRPGGRLIFIEHVRAEGFGGRVQDVVKPVWRYFGAGCNLNRRTEQALRDARFDITSIEQTRLAVLPAIYGTAVPA
jgi:ubiquinone/menaquinone biosynthesis C-methylase UbiE